MAWSNDEGNTNKQRYDRKKEKKSQKRKGKKKNQTSII
jgi:hypothetical protein